MEKPRLETSLPEMESFEACDGGNKVPGFQEINQQKLKLPSDEGIMEDRMQHQPGLAVIKMSAESSEVVLGEIDKEIKKYDPKPSVPPVSSVILALMNQICQVCQAMQPTCLYQHACH